MYDYYTVPILCTRTAGKTEFTTLPAGRGCKSVRGEMDFQIASTRRPTVHGVVKTGRGVAEIVDDTVS